MSVSLTDILTATKNVVTSISTAAQNYLNVQGAQGFPHITSATLVKASAGRIAVISVTTAGSTTGTVYDSNSTSMTTMPIYIIPNTVGLYVVNLPVNNGVLVVPGTSQVVTVSFS
jgi:hypothetical protein